MDKAKKLARRLLRKNRGTHSKPARSWRVIVREDYPGGIIKHGTLSRFAISDGEWLPKDERILIALGLKKERKPRPVQKRLSISDLTNKELKMAVKQRDLAQRLGWLRSSQGTHS